MSEITPIPQEILEQSIASEEKIVASLVRSCKEEINRTILASDIRPNDGFFRLKKLIQTRLSDRVLQPYVHRTGMSPEDVVVLTAGIRRGTASELVEEFQVLAENTDSESARYFFLKKCVDFLKTMVPGTELDREHSSTDLCDESTT